MKTPLLSLAAGLALVAASAVSAFAQGGSQSTLDRIKARGHIVCGTSEGVPGFSLQDGKGVWNGFDTDVCRALAAAIFNDQDKAQYLSLSSKNRLVSLQSGEIDVLARTTTWTLSRDIGQGLSFTAVNYYDGQGFILRKKLGVNTVKELNGASVCVAQGTTTELNLADYGRTNNLKFETVAFATLEETVAAYEAGRCDAYTTDLSSLAGTRNKLQKPDEHILLQEVISKEPLGPWVRKSDQAWFDIVRWTVFALINAEELGVTRANVEELAKTSQNPEVRRMLGAESKFGESLGLSNDWVVRIVKAVGNYGESFERHFGAQSRNPLPRGVNKLWSQGGLQYAPPIR
ncbi:amino-acid transporter subunit; periplasmic-binding component of ABC superfamily [Bosea sp. 62]|uniref:amino acid ABC transporter substrate-binding protein n=1 Tax=unclassified Bosea (in: a-proteobacteria) TaxID=2653178 RepID=UPI00125A6280|nr:MULTISPECIES: amino acid ABC transporter substrate-binding protein [unclassified Bosea (in: a-proteobacteria)]CAD5293206.1 amino-acid transporter subunit; periplasmic-binding component of ABC superfamily [Bosea sp. 7B]CAD5298629.1 amino-acid transporter subunit; periplasmic-binding component of ABC superfamily [Bosea sp. 21B]CAD5298792.1 amino-acid transporter subunit; periplasmic-binding component of ABC superfamily [Bosea sp. 46]VVT61507.1 amino-acid transporter subunit; periplasmic-bindin